MKIIINLISSIMLLSLLTSCISIQTVESSKIQNSQVIKLRTDMNKSKIFKKAKKWITANFRSAKAVIEYENEEEASITSNTSLKAKCLGIYSDCKYHVSMRLDAKNGRIRVKFIKAYFIYSNGDRSSIQYQMYDDYKNAIDNLVFSLVNYIEGRERINKNDDW